MMHGGMDMEGRERMSMSGEEDDGPPTTATATAMSHGMGSSMEMVLALSPDPNPNPPKLRGRPPGSGSRQILSTLGEWFALSAGGNFTPHVVTIPSGQDVATRILSFAHKGPRSICILSANGAISNVTLRQPGSSGGTLAYEGRFEILSLSGSFTVTGSGGVRSRTGGLSVSLAGPDGRVIGGGVAGLLLAASPIQVVVGSFMPNVVKELKRKATTTEPSPFPQGQVSVPVFEARPVSMTQVVNPEDELEGPTWSRHRHGAEEDGARGRENMFRNMGWHGLHSSSSQQQEEHKHHKQPPSDINISLRGE